MSLQWIRPSVVKLLREFTVRNPTFRHVSSTKHYQAKHISTTACLQKKRKVPANPEEDRTDVNDPLKSALKSVAESLPGDAQKTQSALLQQLKAHAKLTETQKEGRERTQAKSSSDMSSLLSSMRIQKVQREQRDFKSGGGRSATSFKADRKARLEKLKLFAAQPLGIFTEKTRPTDLKESKGRSLWDEVEAESLDRLSLFPPENEFEEMIQMTKEGKLWTFPINNEAGMVEEENIGFHEHVFLEGLIEDFPKRGPIRIFMELVITGLSKNPYLTVRQKHEHVEWFRRYFQEKQGLLKESLGDDGILKTMSENQLQ